MIAAIRLKGRDPSKPCVIRWTGRVRLHVSVKTWCDEQLGADDSADAGVLQLPDGVETCEGCKVAIIRYTLDNGAT